MTTEAGRAGCSYFGVRIARHVRRDMADLAARGYTGVLHTFSENDLAYYRETMAEIVAASHAEGLFVQASPWGVGRTFGGEAEYRDAVGLTVVARGVNYGTGFEIALKIR
jgi:hypothetical protein